MKAAAVAPSRRAGPDATSRKRVLIVDDDEALSHFFAKTLRTAQYHVTCAGNGRAAARLLESDAFDVIVSDISMPGMSGIELLQMVRKRDLDVPVVLVTGEPDVGSAIRAVEHGALRYLEKPVGPLVLRDVVARAVQLHELARIKRKALSLLGESSGQAWDRAGLEAAFADVLGSLRMGFQPILQCSPRALFGYEALLRTSSPTLPNPIALLEAAERLERVQELSRTIRAVVTEALPFLDPRLLVFVNLHPPELSDEELYSPTAPLSAHADRVVLEVTERSRLDHVPDLTERIAALRSLGYRLAVDDLGAGYAGLTSFIQLDPEFVKIDMTLTRDLHRSERKQRLVRSTLELCREMDIRVVAEGVESHEELAALLDLGADLLQGYLLGKPSQDFRAVSPEILNA